MKRVRLIITDANQAEDEPRPTGKNREDLPHAEVSSPKGIKTTNGMLRLESIVSETQSEALVQAVLRELNDGGEAVHANDLISAELGKVGPDADNVYYDIMSLVERELIKKVLNENEGVQTKAATRLGINRNTLHKKMQQLGLADSSEEQHT